MTAKGTISNIKFRKDHSDEKFERGNKPQTHAHTRKHARRNSDAHTAYWPHMPSFFHIKVGYN
jgi:hypothetical protein